ncbi:MAG: DUF481 domain-containing protein [Blastochloris sp.]|nr:DUF481 domain-containing protein [Blastochloris sp.]
MPIFLRLLPLLLLSSYLHAATSEQIQAEYIHHLEKENAQLREQVIRHQQESLDYQRRYQAALQGDLSPEAGLSPQSASLWKAEVGLGASLSRGNNDAYQVNLSAKAVRKTDLDELVLALNADLGENEGEKTSEKGKASADYRRQFDKKWYWLLGSSLERDQLADLEFRATVGPGVGYRFFDSDQVKLSLEAGPAFVAEKFTDDSIDYSARGRIGDRFEFKLTQSATLFQSTELLFNFQDTEDAIVTNELGVETKLNSALSLRVFGKHRYDHLPAPGTRQNDVSLISALVYKFE